MLKDQLTSATHIARKSGPWVSLATAILVIASDLSKTK